MQRALLYYPPPPPGPYGARHAFFYSGGGGGRARCGGAAAICVTPNDNLRARQLISRFRIDYRPARNFDHVDVPSVCIRPFAHTRISEAHLEDFTWRAHDVQMTRQCAPPPASLPPDKNNERSIKSTRYSLHAGCRGVCRDVLQDPRAVKRNTSFH